MEQTPPTAFNMSKKRIWLFSYVSICTRFSYYMTSVIQFPYRDEICLLLTVYFLSYIFFISYAILFHYIEITHDKSLRGELKGAFILPLIH